MRNGLKRQPSPPGWREPPARRRNVGVATLVALFLRAPTFLIMGALTTVIVFAVVYLIYHSDGPASGSAPAARPADPRYTETVDTPTNSIGQIAAAGEAGTWSALDPAFRNYKIQINNDGSLQADKQAVELYGVKMLPRSRICSYRTGERWACGQRAYIALRNVIGATTIDCRPKDPAQADVLICRLASTDISELMLHEGWATLTSGVTERKYIDAAAAAFVNKSGMWSLLPPPRNAN